MLVWRKYLLKKGRGRPLGFRLTEASKRAISESKKGQKHSEETKRKISKTLMMYFRTMHPISKEFIEEYGDILANNEDIMEWFEGIKDQLDDSEYVLTERALNSKRLRELAIEYNMEIVSGENLNGFTLNPEVLLELKELCKENGLSFEDLQSSFDVKSIKNLLR